MYWDIHVGQGKEGKERQGRGRKEWDGRVNWYGVEWSVTEGRGGGDTERTYGRQRGTS